MGVSKNRCCSPQIIHFNRVFIGFPLFSPSILGFLPPPPYFWVFSTQMKGPFRIQLYLELYHFEWVLGLSPWSLIHKIGRQPKGKAWFPNHHFSRVELFVLWSVYCIPWKLHGRFCKTSLGFTSFTDIWMFTSYNLILFWPLNGPLNLSI